ncbi:DUF3391 domain-containing protein, partial [Pseudomonas aeruginosa]|uniref:DUF3391 domain-containing protein n=1 Tax=Pseudomonas aeruginosa TaxID=287 RepID=UPI0037240A7F
MVKRIPVSELRLGMYIHKLAGSWVRHPFWRGSFLLTEPQDLSAIRECGVGEVWVDLAKSGTVAKLAMRQPFVLFKGLTFQKLCLPGAFRPGDHHN